MKTVRLREESYNTLKSVLVNEISKTTLGGAYSKGNQMFDNMIISFEDFYDTVENCTEPQNPYVRKIKEHADAIKEILSRKEYQNFNFGQELNK